MNREFLKLYERELRVLFEHGAEFSKEHPNLARRLGEITTDRADPMIGGLLEGAAFLAARVQLTLKQEFPEFTANLLDQLVPGYLAPVPSAVLLGFAPPYGDPGLDEGRALPRHASVDAAYRERQRGTTCRFRLCDALTLWPFELVDARYFVAPGQIAATGIAAGPEVAAGLCLTLVRRTTARRENEPEPDSPKARDAWFASCRADRLTFHLLGAEADADGLYEQVFANCNGVHLQFTNPGGRNVVLDMPLSGLSQIGFAEAEMMLPNGKRVFRGFDLLREYFHFPRKFLGFALNGLNEVLPKVQASAMKLLLTFDRSVSRLAGAVHAGAFALHAVPAINLFRRPTDRIALDRGQHEYPVVADRSHPMDNEIHTVEEVFGFLGGSGRKVKIPPLYAAPPEAGRLSYTLRRDARVRSAEEREHGTASDYVGTEVFLSLAGAGQDAEAGGPGELGVTALCTNRHLAGQLPVGSGGVDFKLVDDMDLAVNCLAGPTAPREPILARYRGGHETSYSGALVWRLINLLTLNHLGLTERAGRRGGDALREVLAVFADIADDATQRRIAGIRSVETQPAIRRIRCNGGAAVARGLEITVTLDERAFSGSGIFLLGAVLDHFFADYVSINAFAETVIRSTDRGLVKRWPPRAGTRRLM